MDPTTVTSTHVKTWLDALAIAGPPQWRRVSSTLHRRTGYVHSVLPPIRCTARITTGASDQRCEIVVNSPSPNRITRRSRPWRAWAISISRPDVLDDEVLSAAFLAEPAWAKKLSNGDRRG
jgi:hypothetical protein